jgi:hypothetical protein
MTAPADSPSGDHSPGFQPAPGNGSPSATRDPRASLTEETLADADQTASDSDQTSADSDQTSADNDQLADLELELQRARRTNTSLVVAYVDLVGLKVRNDTFGHAAGDALQATDDPLEITAGFAELGADDTLAELMGRADRDLIEHRRVASEMAYRPMGRAG